jgi:hypothetical protein
MEPEEIIQQKEWENLTQADRALLSSLVTDKEEYYLLKNILLNGIEDTEPVPLINTSVQQNLRKQFNNNLKKRPLIRMYYAAASVILIIVAAGLIFQFSNNKKEAKNLIVLHQKIFISHGYTVQSKKNEPLIEKDTLVHVAVAKNKRKSKSKSLPKKVFVEEQNFDMAINTLINKDKNMLALITEVY